MFEFRTIEQKTLDCAFVKQTLAETNAFVSVLSVCIYHVN